jgi:hypothetical protein
LWENLLENLYLEDGKDNIKMDIRYIDCEVDETGWGSCPLTGFHIGDDVPAGSGTTVLRRLIWWSFFTTDFTV